MNIPTRAELDKLNDKYPRGTRIQLIAMHQEQYPVPSGTTGTVVGVDDLGHHLHDDSLGLFHRLLFPYARADPRDPSSPTVERGLQGVALLRPGG